MKNWATTAAAAAGLGLMASLTSTSATLVQFKDKLEAMSSHERDRIAFNEYEVHPVPHFLLGMDEPDDAFHPSCEVSNKAGKKKAEILIVISKCLSDVAVDNVNAWIASINGNTLQHDNDDGTVTELKFVTTMIDDDCPSGNYPPRGPTDEDDTTTPEDGGAYAYKSQALLAAAPREMQRLQAFAGFGRVLADTSEVEPIAVLSFANSEKSFAYVETYKTEHNITNTFNFQMCPSASSCSKTFKDSVKLTDPVELFMYNPFKIIRSLECKKLEGGIPVTYTTKANKKGKKKQKCFCMCPVGTVYTPGDDYTGTGPSCKAPEETPTCDCVWKQPNECYHHANPEPMQQCLFTNLATSWKVPVPFPLDNYVAAGRKNVADGPQINLIVTRKETNVFTYADLNGVYAGSYPNSQLSVDAIQASTKDKLIAELANGRAGVRTPVPVHEAEMPVDVKKYEWKDYQQNRVAKIDSIELHQYGKYKLELVASDYVTTRNATCEGCVSVVDKFRPMSNQQCPTPMFDATASDKKETAPGCVEATSDQLTKLQDLVDAVYKFSKDVTNDGCSSERCDTKEFTLQDWFATDYSTDRSFDEGESCLGKSTLQQSLKDSEKAMTNPLVGSAGGACQQDVPVAAFSCRRCCKYGVELKEWWTDYKCANDDYDISQCEGREDEKSNCNLAQCVVLDGKTLASASVCLKDSVRADSKKVIDELEVKGFQAVTQVHRGLTCTAFDPKKAECAYEAAIGELVDATYKTEFFQGDESKYVFWRYKITGDEAGWRLWNPKTTPKPADKYKFTNPSTEIVIEAWTACGRVHQSIFFVKLHLQTDIKVCEFFPKMWYQTTVSKPDFKADLCAYPGSDFAELTFEYQANIGLQYSREKLRMEVTGVQCEISIEGRTAAPILSAMGNSMDILERYAVQMKTLETTAPNTKFNVTCSFTYTRFDKTTQVVACSQPFTITDCDAPTIDTPSGNCAYDNCIDKPLPGPYQACGGNVVTSTATATKFETMTGDACCQGCTDSKSTCSSILELPDGSEDDIKRCVPETPTGEYNAYGSDTNSYSTYSTTAYLAQAAARHPTAAAATVLLASSAMVALVALVVVRQRRTPAHQEVVIEDAYYPLLN